MKQFFKRICDSFEKKKAKQNRNKPLIGRLGSVGGFLRYKTVGHYVPTVLGGDFHSNDMACVAEKFWSSFSKSLRGLGAAPRVARRNVRNSLIVQSARRGECSPVGSRGETTSGVSPIHAEDSIKDSYRLEWTVEGLAAARSHVSLRSTTALTPPRGVIHYRGAASLRRSLQFIGCEHRSFDRYTATICGME